MILTKEQCTPEYLERYRFLNLKLTISREEEMLFLKDCNFLVLPEYYDLDIPFLEQELGRLGNIHVCLNSNAPYILEKLTSDEKYVVR